MKTLLNALRAAAEPTRLRVLALCSDGALTVSELMQILGQSQPRVSRHLKVLTDAGLLDRAPEGNWVFHGIRRTGEAARIAAALVSLVPADDPESILDRRRLAEVKADRRRRAEAYFVRNASDWNAMRALSLDDKDVDTAIGAALAGQSVGRLLDIGTGTGRMLELLGDRASAAVGIDSSAAMLQVARANLERSGLDRCAVRQGDMYHLPFADRAFDTVTIHQVLHYADSPERVIREAARVLAPGGRLLIVDFAPHSENSLRKDHQHRRLGFSDDEVADWLRAAGLAPGRTTRLPGKPLTIVVWLAINPGAPARPTDRPRPSPLEFHR